MKLLCISVVERILQNHRSVPLMLNDVRLSVCALRPAPLSPRLIGEAESDKLLVTNIPEDSSTDDLERYIQRGSGTPVTKLRYSMKPGVAMAEFKDTFGEAHVNILLVVVIVIVIIVVIVTVVVILLVIVVVAVINRSCNCNCNHSCNCSC